MLVCLVCDLPLLDLAYKVFEVVLLALVVFFSAPFISTFADRIGSYLICLQIYVVSRVPVLIEDNIFRGLVTAGVSCLYAVVLFVWLNYASHAYYWIPYQSLILP